LLRYYYITLHKSYSMWSKYKTAKPLTVHSVETETEKTIYS